MRNNERIMKKRGSGLKNWGMVPSEARFAAAFAKMAKEAGATMSRKCIPCSPFIKYKIIENRTMPNTTPMVPPSIQKRPTSPGLIWPVNVSIPTTSRVKKTPKG